MGSINNLAPNKVIELVDILLKDYETSKPVNIEYTDDTEYVSKWYRKLSDEGKSITDQCVKNIIDHTFYNDFENIQIEFNNAANVIKKLSSFSVTVLDYYNKNYFSQDDLDYFFNNLKMAVKNGILCYNALNNFSINHEN
jgi:hypothetical protein